MKQLGIWGSLFSLFLVACHQAGPQELGINAIVGKTFYNNAGSPACAAPENGMSLMMDAREFLTVDSNNVVNHGLPCGESLEIVPPESIKIASDGTSIEFQGKKFIYTP